MKAAVFHKFGDADGLKVEDVPTPKPKAGHVLVKILAAGVNRFDHYLREGGITQHLPLPHVLGSDGAGEVAELGEGTNSLHVGDRVVIVPGFPLKEEDYDIRPANTAPSFTLPGLGMWGTYAQYIEVPARWVLTDDTKLKTEEVATLPVCSGDQCARREGCW